MVYVSVSHQVNKYRDNIIVKNSEKTHTKYKAKLTNGYDGKVYDKRHVTTRRGGKNLKKRKRKI